MAFTARTETYADTAAATSLECSVPTGTSNGDILFMTIVVSNSSTVTLSGLSAWTSLGNYNTSGTDKYYLYYRIASSEPASYTITIDKESKYGLCMSCFTSGNFDGSDPIDVVSNTGYRSSDNYCRAAAMTVSAANSPLVFFGLVSTTSGRTFTKPSNIGADAWTENEDRTNLSSDISNEICSMIWTGSGSTGDMTATLSNTSSTKHAFAVALNPASAGTAKAYSGGGGISLDSNVLKARGKNPSVSGAFSFNSGVATKLAKLYVFASGGVRVYDSGAVTSLTVVEPANEYDYAADAVMVYADGSVLSKGKAFVSNGSFYYVANPVLAKGKVPSVGGSVAYAASAVTERVKLWIYPGNGAQVYASDADTTSTSSVWRTYVGEGVLVFDSGVEVAIGKVFTGDGLFHFAAGTISVASAQVSYSYSGLNSGAIAYDNVTVYLRTYGTARHKESLPVRPSSQDGAWTDGVSDGAWTEEYVHGAYTDIGYDKEAKPFTRFTQTKESAPSSSYAAEGVGVLVEEGQLGILAEPGSLGVRDTYVRTLEGKPTWSGSDESAPLGTYTLEAKPTA